MKKGSHRMEYAIRSWLKPIFNCEGSHWVDEKNIFYERRVRILPNEIKYLRH